MTNTLALMKEVATLRKSIAEKSTAELLQRQGLQYNLKEMYKPITESHSTSASNIKSEIVDKINEVTQANNDQFNNFKQRFTEFPNLVRNVENLKNDLVERTDAIIQDIKIGNSEAGEKIDTLIENQGQFEEILHSFKPDPVVAEYVKVIGKHPVLKNYIVSKGDDTLTDPSDEERKILTGFRDLTYDQQNSVRSYLLLVPDKEPTAQVPEDLRSISFSTKVYPNDVLSILDFMDANKTNLKTDEFFKDIKAKNPQVFDILTIYKKGNRSVKATTRDNLIKLKENQMSTDDFINWLQKNNPKGSGFKVEYLPSDVNELSQELARLVGSYKSGNKNTSTYNKINDIVDILRRNGIFSIDEVRNLYKELSEL